MDRLSSLTGVILAGGRSRRFGSDKVFALHRGQTFFDISYSLMKSIFREVIVVANEPEKFSHVDAIVLKDEIPFQGPLGGIITALRWVKSEGIFVIACDMPLLSREVVLDLIKKDDGSDVVAYAGQPLCAIYRTLLLPLLERRLSRGGRDLHSLCEEEIKIQKISLEGTKGRQFLNVNTPEDLQQIFPLVSRPLSTLYSAKDSVGKNKEDDPL